VFTPVHTDQEVMVRKFIKGFDLIDLKIYF